MLLLLGVSLGAAAGPGRKLAQLLEQCLDQEKEHPDSLFANIRMLEQNRLQAATPQDRAMYATMLGCLYADRQHRAVRWGHSMEANPDSIQEWSGEQYLQTARERFAEALKDVNLLAGMKISDWLPVVERGNDAGLYGRDMLHVVYQAAIDYLGARPSWPTFAVLIDHYRQCNLMDAVVQLELDSLGSRYLPGNQRCQRLIELTEQYAQVPRCAEVYLQLGEMMYKQTPEEQAEWLIKGIRLYPRYCNIAKLKNQLNELKAPMLTASAHTTLYPGADMRMIVERRNVREMRVCLYKLVGKVEDENEENLKWLRGHASLAVEKVFRFAAEGETEYRTYHDTLNMAAPECGRYAVVIDGTPRLKVGNKPVIPTIKRVRVSRMLPVTTTLQTDKSRVMVVDAQSGAPIPDVQVTMVHGRQTKNEFRETSTTDKRGIADFQCDHNTYTHVELVKGDDCWLPDFTANVAYFNRKQSDSILQERIYTDRSIYHPGQTMMVGGLVYSQKEWDAHTSSDRKMHITLRDPNRKEVADTTVITDDYGMVSATFELPKSCLPGSYELRMGNAHISVRVEEYKRPTFEVKMDAVPDIKLPADSITLTGKAVTYAGVPIRNARVTGTCNPSGSIWYTRIYGVGEMRENRVFAIDSVLTDEYGIFSVTVPIRGSETLLKYGQVLHLQLDVLAPNGETQHASTIVSVCTTPLRMWANVPEKQDKERLSGWSFEVVGPTGVSVDALVTSELRRSDGTVVLKSQTKANSKPTVPAGLKDVPSGAYTLYNIATLNGDSAVAKKRVVLFSMQDNTLPTDTTIWFYMPKDRVSVGEDVLVQIGTSQNDVSMYCLIQSDHKVLKDTLMHMNNEMQTLRIPYTREMGQGACISFMYVRDNKLYREQHEVYLQQPDKQLRMKWKTFRDKLHPGDQEKWTLTLTRPDGTPASANLMATMYDASLDALYPYSMRLSQSMSYSIPNTYISNPMLGRYYDHYGSVGFPIPYLKEYEWRISSINRKYVTERIAQVARSKNMLFSTAVRVRGEGAMVLREVPVMMKSMSTADFESAAVKDEALAGRIAGLDLEEVAPAPSPAETEEANADPLTEVPLRQNFNETAFFYPQLRTNGDGEVNIEFTLPESLTSWHLNGVAHTQDMCIGTMEETIVASKELMAQLYLPRFLRVGDEATLTATIHNMVDDVQNVNGRFSLIDPDTGKEIYAKKVRMTLSENQDTTLYYCYSVKTEKPLLICRWVVQGNEVSDGEQRYLPVLSDQETVLQTRVLTLDQKGRKTVDISKLFPKGSSHQRLTIEYTARPTWMALQALPSMAHPCHSDVTSIASAYYATSLARYILNMNPRMHDVIAQWRKQGVKGRLAENEEVKTILMNETPWVRDAERETNRIQELVKLLDEDARKETTDAWLEKLGNMQLADGSFTWYPGMKGSEYLTREVAYLLARLQHLTQHTEAQKMQEGALAYLRSKLDKELDYSSLSHLYIVGQMHATPNKTERQLIDKLKKEAKKWDEEDRALASIVLYEQGEKSAARKLLKGIEEYLVDIDGRGMSIDYPGGNNVSINRKIAIHVQIMEALQTVTPEDTIRLKEMTRWLLSEKRTQDWDSPMNSVNAVYALLNGNASQLDDQATDRLSVMRDKHTIATLAPKDAALGYLRESVEMTQSPKTLVIDKQSTGQSWGAVYAQCVQPLSQVEASRQGLNIRRDISKPDSKVGDRIHIKYTITADRDYEYVMMRAGRASGMEPAEQLSGYRWDGRLGYYRVIRDASTEYFFDRLPKGTYVVEEDVMVERPGQYSAGLVTIQCMYAPEFTAKTQDMRVNIAR